MMDQYHTLQGHDRDKAFDSSSGYLENVNLLLRVENPALKDSIKKGIIFKYSNDRGGKDSIEIQFLSRVGIQVRKENAA